MMFFDQSAEDAKEDFVSLAPYDLKVTKVELSVGSGTNDGNTILEVQKL